MATIELQIKTTFCNYIIIICGQCVVNNFQDGTQKIVLGGGRVGGGKLCLFKFEGDSGVIVSLGI